MQQALVFVWNHAYHHRRTYGIQRSHHCRVCGVWMREGVKTGSGNLVVFITNELPCGRKMELGVCIIRKYHTAVITVLLLEFWEVELVHAVPSRNFAHNFLMVVITQSSAKLLVSHVCSAIPLTPQISHLVGSFDRELPICSFP